MAIFQNPMLPLCHACWEWNILSHAMLKIRILNCLGEVHEMSLPGCKCFCWALAGVLAGGLLANVIRSRLAHGASFSNWIIPTWTNTSHVLRLASSVSPMRISLSSSCYWTKLHKKDIHSFICLLRRSFRCTNLVHARGCAYSILFQKWMTEVRKPGSFESSEPIELYKWLTELFQNQCSPVVSFLSCVMTQVTHHVNILRSLWWQPVYHKPRVGNV